MKKQLLYGVLVVLTSAPGNLIPRALGLGGEDWLATAAMRYAWAIVFLYVVARYRFGKEAARQLVRLFNRNKTFWLIWALVSGPLLYVSCIYAATCVPIWVIAVTLRLNMLATVLVLRFFGQRASREKILVLLFIFLGVIVINIENVAGTWQAKSVWAMFLLLTSVLLESFSDQLMQDARWGRQGRLAWIPHINDSSVGTSTHCWLLILYVLSLPQLAVGLAMHPVLPSLRQVWATAIMAGFTSLISSALWMKFRLSAGTSADRIALADATPALGIVVSLFRHKVHKRRPKTEELACSAWLELIFLNYYD